MGATRYFGKPCARHPELNGERRSGDRHCIGCERAKAAAYRRRNPEAERRRSLEADRRWSKRHPEKKRASSAKRRALKREALVSLTPTDHQRIVALYAEAARRTAETGIAHHVDHDVPLALGGKHHPDNLLVVPAAINLAKGAKYASTWDFISS